MMLPPSLEPDVEYAVRAHPHYMITVIDRWERFCYASPSAKELFGYEPTEIVGRPFTDFFNAANIAHIRLALEDAKLNGLSIEITREVKLKQGGYRRMRGPIRYIRDHYSGDKFELAIGRPID
jgi:PAS domain S-box-containing protein